MPHDEAGNRIEPPPSQPSAMGIIPAATALALPPEEPPEWYCILQGLMGV